MPKAMHRALERQARKKGIKGERKKRYVFGTMAKAKAKAKKKKKKGR